MRKGITIIILVNLIFIIAQLRYFSLAIPYAQTHLFMEGFIVDMALYAMSLVIFIKFYDTTNWGKVELIAVINIILWD